MLTALYLVVASTMGSSAMDGSSGVTYCGPRSRPCSFPINAVRECRDGDARFRIEFDPEGEIEKVTVISVSPDDLYRKYAECLADNVHFFRHVDVKSSDLNLDNFPVTFNVVSSDRSCRRSEGSEGAVDHPTEGR